MTTRLPHIEYFEQHELPIGEIPNSVLRRAKTDEIFFRKFTPSDYITDLSKGHVSALLYWFPYYRDVLYDKALSGQSYMEFFAPFPKIIKVAFKWLFRELVRRLNVLSRSVRENHLGETKFKKGLLC